MESFRLGYRQLLPAATLTRPLVQGLVDFRQRLDAVLRTLNVQQVTEFLIAEKQCIKFCYYNFQTSIRLYMPGSSFCGAYTSISSLFGLISPTVNMSEM